jgi:hypothetical protein
MATHIGNPSWAKPCTRPQKSITPRLVPLPASSTPASIQARLPLVVPPPQRRCHKAPPHSYGGYCCHLYDGPHALYVPRGLHQPELSHIRGDAHYWPRR